MDSCNLWRNSILDYSSKTLRYTDIADKSARLLSRRLCIPFPSSTADPIFPLQSPSMLMICLRGRWTPICKLHTAIAVTVCKKQSVNALVNYTWKSWPLSLKTKTQQTSLAKSVHQIPQTEFENCSSFQFPQGIPSSGTADCILHLSLHR